MKIFTHYAGVPGHVVMSESHVIFAENKEEATDLLLTKFALDNKSHNMDREYVSSCIIEIAIPILPTVIEI